MHQSSPTMGPQMMYPYGAAPHPGHQQSHNMQHMSRPSPPQPTWAVPQAHNPYYQMPRGPAMGNREDNGHLLPRSETTSSQSPAHFSNSMHSSTPLASTDYFPGVIDTSRYTHGVTLLHWANDSRSLGSKSVRRARVISFAGSGCWGLQPRTDGPG
jgi:hypothetical protein